VPLVTDEADDDDAPRVTLACKKLFSCSCKPMEKNMNCRVVLSVVLAIPFLMNMLAPCTAADEVICSIVRTPQDFDHKSVTLKGTAINVKETTSRRGNDYTTFKLQDSAGCAVTIFTWGHPTLNTCDQVSVDGVFETERHQGRYTFYNEIQATKVSCLPR
jgi:hypothetical protein